MKNIKNNILFNDINSIYSYVYDDRNIRCLGIIKTPNFSSNNDIIDVEFKGNISDNYKNLIAGYDYFIQENGEIGIFENDYYFGTAITNDKILF
jgi:hypothetical protein